MKIQFKKQIHGCFAAGSSLDKYVIYECDLPFIPTKEIDYKVSQNLIIDGIEQIVFDVDKNIFIVYVEADKELYKLDSKLPKRLIKEIVQEYIESGWKEYTR